MKLLKYFVVGSCAAVIDIGLFYVLVMVIGWPWLPVSICTFVLATLANYFLSIAFVFESGNRHKKHVEIFGVFVLSLIALLINQLMLYLLIESLQWYPLLAKCIATCTVFFWNYFGRSRFIFANKPQPL